ncbi:MAG: FAD-linked oxidase [Bdellovibrionales bacterium RBG_16_40_8]|nr:MAG: FAD-linked oxidase [Bdellovibrionales bacterium RBG_16_40_8]
MTMIEGIETHTDVETLTSYGKDWTKHFTPKPKAVVFPRSTEQVRDLVLWARKNKVALVPSGGRTGLSAAAYATNGEVVVSLEKMNKILEIDYLDQVIRCEAGVVTERLQKKAWDNGFYYPVDFAARGSSQIGGNVATNAGGIKVIRYGLTRQWVTSLKVVTGIGEILELNKSLVKNATGYDLRHLFIGSEGTLGIITEVTVALTKQPKEPVVFVLGTNELSSIMEIYKRFKQKFLLSAYEMFTDLALKYVTSQCQVPPPFSTPSRFYILIEIEKDSDELINKAMELFTELSEEGLITDGTVSQSPKQVIDLWKLRENITEATSHKQPYKNDVSVRVSRVPQFLVEMSAILAKEHPDFEVVWFGHVGDGNLHINILKPDNMENTEFVKRCKHVDEIMFHMLERLEGSISAEHGVGLVKKPFLKHSRSLNEISLMRQIKKVFDPDGIMNPGKIFD